MNPCTNGCQPPRSALFFRCPDRLIDPGSYVPLPPSSRVDPCRIFPSRCHRGSIHVVCPPSCPFLLSNRPSRSLPSFSRRRESGALPAVLPAPYRYSCSLSSFPRRRESGTLRPTSIHRGACNTVLPWSGTRCNPQRACYGRTYPVHYNYTNDAAGLVLRRANPPYRVIEICGFSMPSVRVCCTI